MGCLFTESTKPVTTVMVQADNPDRIKELMEKSAAEGAEAFGIQFEQMLPVYRTKKVYKELFEFKKDMPKYVTNYRVAKNSNKSDEVLAGELTELAECGADLCDVMGDYFDKQPNEITFDKSAIDKQITLINNLHERGAKVLISSHINKFTSEEQVIKIASEHQKRGADISKIVVSADNMEQQIENLKIINMLKNILDIPFLFLSAGECRILRRIGGELGCCMYLCVYEYDELATSLQPLLTDIKMIRKAFNL